MGGKTETTTKPLKPVWEKSKEVLGGAQDLYQSGQPTYAQFSPTTQRALEGIEARSEQGSPVFAAGQQNLMDTIQGKYLDPSSNQHLRQYYEAAAGGVQDRINAEFSKAGRYGSGAHAGTTARELSNLAAKIYAPAYQQERGLQFGAMRDAPRYAGQEYADWNNMLGAGQIRDVKAQQGVDDPYNQLMRYLSVIQGAPSGQKQTQTTTPGALDYIGTIGGLAGSIAAAVPTGGMSLAGPALSGVTGALASPAMSMDQFAGRYVPGGGMF